MTSESEIRLFRGEDSGLAWKFQVNPSSCGNHEHYEDYIRFIALGDRSKGKGVTYVFLHNRETSTELLGYITLRATSYIEIIEGKTYGNSALEIFELAVSKDVERQGIGTDLIKFALSKALEWKTSLLGIEYITLCSDANAVPFYEKSGFKRVDEYGEIPRDQWNTNCIPMFLKLPELPNYRATVL